MGERCRVKAWSLCKHQMTSLQDTAIGWWAESRIWIVVVGGTIIMSCRTTWIQTRNPLQKNMDSDEDQENMYELELVLLMKKIVILWKYGC